MAEIKFNLSYRIPRTATLDEAIELVKRYIEEDGISSAINKDTMVEYTTGSGECE